MPQMLETLEDAVALALILERAESVREARRVAKAACAAAGRCSFCDAEGHEEAQCEVRVRMKKLWRSSSGGSSSGRGGGAAAAKDGERAEEEWGGGNMALARRARGRRSASAGSTSAGRRRRRHCGNGILKQLHSVQHSGFACKIFRPANPTTTQQFRVQWGGSGGFVAKNSEATSWHELLHYFGQFSTEFCKATKRSKMHPNSTKRTKTSV